MQSFENAAVLKEVARIRAYCTDDRPALPSGRTAWAMAWLHLVIWNSWKGTYFYADKIADGDFDNYRQYALLSFKHLADHHDAEEENLFPALEKKMPGKMDKNEEQHKSFLNELVEIIKYIESTDPSLENATSFDAAVFKGMIDPIVLPVMTHLADELDTITSSELLEFFSEDDIDVLNKGTHQGKQGDPKKMLPFILLYLQNLPQPSPFPPAPGFVKNIISPWMMYWKFKGLWKYTTYPYSLSLEPVPKL